MTALFNGKVVDVSWLNERGFQFGDGLFETIAVFGGELCLLDSHLARLSEGCSRLKLPKPNVVKLTDELQQFVSQYANGVLKLYWTAGESQRGYARTQLGVPNYFAKFNQWPDQSHIDINAVNVITCETRLARQPLLAGIKHLNRLEQVLARNEWQDKGIAEGLVFDTENFLIEGTMSNVFVERSGELFTPSLEYSGVSGVVRGLAFKLASKHSYTITEKLLTSVDLFNADAVYLTNSVIGVWRVNCINDHLLPEAYPEHGLISLIREKYLQK